MKSETEDKKIQSCSLLSWPKLPTTPRQKTSLHPKEQATIRLNNVSCKSKQHTRLFLFG